MISKLIKKIFRNEKENVAKDVKAEPHYNAEPHYSEKEIEKWRAVSLPELIVKLKSEEALLLFLLQEIHKFPKETAEKIWRLRRRVLLRASTFARRRMSLSVKDFLLENVYKIENREAFVRKARELLPAKRSEAAMRASEKRRKAAMMAKEWEAGGNYRQILKEEKRRLNFERLRQKARQSLIEREYRKIPENQRIRFIPSETKELVWRRDRAKCVQCGSQNNLEFDHIIPFSKGGSNTARNIQLLCESCNRKKHAAI